MPVHEVNHPLIKHKLGLMREQKITTKDFRDLASELGNLLTYEATKDMETEKKSFRVGPVRWKWKGSRARKSPWCRS